LITAHGISDRAHDRLRASGKRIIDTTCPLVRRVHRAARAFEEGGFQVIVIGRKGHVEVDGIVGDLTKFEVVQTPADVRRYATNRIGIVCQTTERQCRVEAIRAEIRAQNPQAEIRFVDTICQPTRDRQAALERLLNVVDVMVVVGGQHSNNTRQLVIRSRERGVLAHHVQSAADLQPQWFQAARTVGLTAGTSTPDSAIQEVYEALSAIQNEGESP
jgi:4-hydroxy-3-methylbut-2-enyl diphosphate reductase